MYLGTVSLRLDFLHYEEARIQKSVNAVDQAALFTPREPRRGRTSDASVAKVQRLYWDGQVKVRTNALFPAHTGKGVNRLLHTRLRLLPIKESLDLFLVRGSVSKRESVLKFNQGNGL